MTGKLIELDVDPSLRLLPPRETLAHRRGAIRMWNLSHGYIYWRNKSLLIPAIGNNRTLCKTREKLLIKRKWNIALLVILFIKQSLCAAIKLLPSRRALDEGGRAISRRGIISLSKRKGIIIIGWRDGRGSGKWRSRKKGLSLHKS